MKHKIIEIYFDGNTFRKALNDSQPVKRLHTTDEIVQFSAFSKNVQTNQVGYAVPVKFKRHSVELNKDVEVSGHFTIPYAAVDHIVEYEMDDGVIDKNNIGFISD